MPVDLPATGNGRGESPLLPIGCVQDKRSNFRWGSRGAEPLGANYSSVYTRVDYFCDSKCTYQRFSKCTQQGVESSKCSCPTACVFGCETRIPSILPHEQHRSALAQDEGKESDSGRCKPPVGKRSCEKRKCSSLCSGFLFA
jgi:hypothetical protein